MFPPKFAVVQQLLRSAQRFCYLTKLLLRRNPGLEGTLASMMASCEYNNEIQGTTEV
jgi:hypothetical protein